MVYQFTDGRVVREDGFIAVQHRTTNGTNFMVGGQAYIFTPRNNVCMGWVAPEHIDRVLGEMARICCGQRGKKFFLASLINVNLYETGRREG
jgi:hypothetical protein